MVGVVVLSYLSRAWCLSSGTRNTREYYSPIESRFAGNMI